MRNVPFFDYSKIYMQDRVLIMEALEKIGTSGAYIMQKELVEFEAKLATFVNSEFALGVANATDGLELAYLALGIGKGDEVIFSSHTMTATASAIYMSGGVPVPVDIGDDGLISPESIELAITPKTVGISPTHLNGRVCDMDSIIKIAEKHGLFIVEDAAQAIGAKFKGRSAGTFGVASCISFYPAKILGCLGDGGGLLTQSESFYQVIRELRDHGKNQNGHVMRWGRNSRLDNFQAAYMNQKILQLHENIDRRREIASTYQRLLGHVEELHLPSPPAEVGDRFDVFQNYEIQAQNREELRMHLTRRGIGTHIQWGGIPVHKMQNLGFDLILPKVEDFFQNCLMLPMNCFLDNKDIFWIAKCILEFYGYSTKSLT